MKHYLSRQILLFFTVFSYLISQDCTIINTDNYGACDNQLGYVWTGNSCSIVYGCDVGDDGEYFFNSYEECDIICSNNAALGDLNNDGYLNVLDVVSIVNFVLNNEYIESSDLNFDGFVNVVDIVALVNIILGDI